GRGTAFRSANLFQSSLGSRVRMASFIFLFLF
ncbi:MAG: hypothetical protein ACI9FY_000941, partial [Patiriisocius sp.]